MSSCQVSGGGCSNSNINMVRTWTQFPFVGLPHLALRQSADSAALCNTATGTSATLFHEPTLLNTCPFGKTQTECVENARARGIFEGVLQVAPQIPQQSKLNGFLQQTGACSLQMKSLLEKESTSSSSLDRATLAKSMHQACNFPQ